MRFLLVSLGLTLLASLSHGDTGTCGSVVGVTLISSIQGSGDRSPLVGASGQAGRKVTVEAIVTQTSLHTSGYRGFWLQEEDSDADGQASTSEGIFVFSKAHSVAVGDQVRLQAMVVEYQGLTELKDVSRLQICGRQQPLPKPHALRLPVKRLANFEALEGMRVEIPSPLLVSDFYGSGYGFGNYGQLVVSSKLHFYPTEIALPGSIEARRLAASYPLDSLLVDDGSARAYPSFIPFPDGRRGYGVDNPVRIGDRFVELGGVMHQIDKDHVLIPDRYRMEATNARTTTPLVSEKADLRIASMNVLNYFNGDGRGNGFPTARGAKTLAAFEMQSAKVVAAIDAMDADIVGLMEIENDGFGRDSAIAHLVTALNKRQPQDRQYRFVNPNTRSGVIGSDDISVGLLYRPARVKPLGQTRILDSVTSPKQGGQPLFDDSRNRPSLIQSFSASGVEFTVAVNHLKSKGSACGELDESADGQGNCNQSRTRAVRALQQYLAQRPTGVNSDANLIIGDLNAYTMEDPVRALVAAGYRNLKSSNPNSLKLATEEQPYSYSFSGLLGSLDHALATPALARYIVSTTIWHINSVEDSLMDYQTEANGQPYKSIDNYARADAYRSSDHDPVVIGLQLIGL